MAFEILWVLSHLFDGMSLSLTLFTWLSSNNYLGEIFISIVRMSILGVILTVKSVNDPVCVRTQDLLVVRFIESGRRRFIAYSFIGDAMLDVDYTSINYARSEYFMNASYYLLLGIEVYLMILLLIKSREKFRTIFILEVAATAVFVIALLLSGLFLNSDTLAVFYQTIVYEWLLYCT